MRAAVRFFFVHFLFGFCRHLPLLAAVTLAFAVVLVPDVNAAFGIRHLIWHEDPLKQAAVGFALGVVVVQALLTGYLLETRWTPPHERPRLRRLGPALTYGMGILTCLLSAGAPVLIAAEPFGGAMRTGWPLVLGFLPAMGLYLMALKLLPTQKRMDSWVGRLGHLTFDGLSQIRLLKVPKAQSIDMPMHGVAALAQIFAILLYLAVGSGPLGLFSPLVGLFALLGIVVALYGFIEYFLVRVQPALVVVVVGLVFLGGIGRYAIRFPDFDDLYRHPIALADYDPACKADLLAPESVDFCGEARGPYSARQRRPLVVVCVSGGGIRAAAWTTAVLHKLEREFGRLDNQPAVDFPCHIRLVTGASGGMAGAAYYVANLPTPPPSPLVRSDLRRQYDAITADCLSPIVHAMTYQDIRSVFSPFGHSRDRGQALERAWSVNLRGVLDQPFERLHAGEAAGWRPSLVFAPMVVEDGRRLLISNLDLRGIASNDGSILQESRDPQYDPALRMRPHLNRFSYESYEFFRLFPDPSVRQRLRVATAARMSASFPYMSPAVTLPTSPRRRIVDAGYYDNDGVSLAASWLFSGSNRDWLRRHVSKIVLIQIRDGASEPGRKLHTIAPDGSTALSRGLEFLTTPPAGLYNARVGSSSFRNDGLLEILSQQLISELQLRPLLKELRESEVEVLQQVRQRDTAQNMMAALSREPAKMRQFRAALDHRRKDGTPAEQTKANQLMAMMSNAGALRQQPHEVAATRTDDQPDQWVDRLLRAPELQAASLKLTPADEAALLALFTQRTRSPADAQRLLQRVKWTFDSKEGTPYFATIAFEYGGEASLSWYLTATEREDILKQADRLQPRVKLLKDWWLAPSTHDGMSDR